MRTTCENCGAELWGPQEAVGRCTWCADEETTGLSFAADTLPAGALDDDEEELP